MLQRTKVPLAAPLLKISDCYWLTYIKVSSDKINYRHANISSFNTWLYITLLPKNQYCYQWIILYYHSQFMFRFDMFYSYFFQTRMPPGNVNCIWRLWLFNCKQSTHLRSSFLRILTIFEEIDFFSFFLMMDLNLFLYRLYFLWTGR